ncbi:MAG: hypothetical protein HY057_14585, partial [Rhodospirillales bacterium]|nr:hypothetical protein [Rhodospirillales bacterium]
GYSLRELQGVVDDGLADSLALGKVNMEQQPQSRRGASEDQKHKPGAKATPAATNGGFVVRGQRGLIAEWSKGMRQRKFTTEPVGRSYVHVALSNEAAEMKRGGRIFSYRLYIIEYVQSIWKLRHIPHAQGRLWPKCAADLHKLRPLYCI